MASAAAPQPGAKPKLFNDAVHGHIALDPLCVKIVDTPEFQRLRDLKQLGGCYLVFPTASHNRFEHSLGVCFLAGSMVDHLASVQPELGITDEERLCVRIAGLCHDLGHGPLSHAFESTFLPAAARLASAVSTPAAPGKPAAAPPEWHHEWASVRMLEHLVDRNGLMDEFRARGLTRESLHFVQELILGDPEDAPPEFAWTGRPEKQFLYDIVANKANGIDTDKGDYFMRDAQMLGMRVGYDWGRMLQFARVAEFEGRLHVCFHEKEAWQLYELFHSRYTLHKRAYQHRVSKVAEMMLVEALLLADPFLRLPGRDGSECRVSESVHDMEAYCRLSDTIFSVIDISSDPRLRPAKDLLRRVRRRDMYAFAGQFVLPHPDKWLFAVTPKGRVDEARFRHSVVALTAGGLERAGWEAGAAAAEAERSVIVDAVRLNYGQGATNPMESVGFIPRASAGSPDCPGPAAGSLTLKAFRIAKEHVSALLPSRFEENTVRAFVRSSDPVVIAATAEAFRKWYFSNVVSKERPLPAASAAPASPEKTRGAAHGPSDPGSAPPTVHAPRSRGDFSRMSPLPELEAAPIRAAKRGRQGDSDCDDQSRDSPAAEHGPGRRAARLFMSQQ